jgi:hypothetical protein
LLRVFRQRRWSDPQILPALRLDLPAPARLPGELASAKALKVEQGV